MEKYDEKAFQTLTYEVSLVTMKTKRKTDVKAINI